jgi:hypothetical protein
MAWHPVWPLAVSGSTQASTPYRVVISCIWGVWTCRLLPASLLHCAQCLALQGLDLIIPPETCSFASPGFLAHSSTEARQRLFLPIQPAFSPWQSALARRCFPGLT